jgi:hypothetical protein
MEARVKISAPPENVNVGQPWSQADVTDLRRRLARENSIGFVADYLCRNEDEVRQKMRELGIAEMSPMERAERLCKQLEEYRFEGEAGPQTNAVD